MQNIRYGILGASKSAESFIKAVNKTLDSEVLAIAGRRLGDATTQAKKFSLKKAYGSYEELCEDAEIDAVYIPTYNRVHYACAKYALKNNKHVLMARPFTHHKVGASELFQLAQNRGLLLMEAQKAVFLPIIKKVKNLIDDDVLGKIRYIDIKEYHNVLDYVDWIYDLGAGGGALNLGGSYPLEITSYLLGKEVTDWAGFDYNKVGEADSRCVLSFKSGDVLVNALISTDFEIESELTIVGTKGEIIIPNYWKATKAELRLGKEVDKIETSKEAGKVYELKHFNECIRKNLTQSPIMTAKRTVDSLTIIESIYQKWYGDPLN